MKEHDFATIEETGEIYYYKRGIFVKVGNSIVRKWVEVIYPHATAHQKNEIVTHGRDDTSISQFDFDKDIDIIVTDNCVLNIHTLEGTLCYSLLTSSTSFTIYHYISRSHLNMRNVSNTYSLRSRNYGRARFSNRCHKFVCLLNPVSLIDNKRNSRD